tara:strand:+ start:4986 stop:5216 length:231 start_codon:yes stop_codon:yes gene_type:complete
VTKEEFKKLQVGDLVKHALSLNLGVVTRMFHNASHTIDIATILWSDKADTYNSQYHSGSVVIEFLEPLSKAQEKHD